MYRKRKFAKKVFINVASLALAAVLLLAGNQYLGNRLDLPPLPKNVTQTVSDAVSGILDAAGDIVDSLYQKADLAQAKTDAQGNLLVHFIDVGQGDCELIQAPEANVLIDAGDVGEGDLVVDYLKAQGVERIDYLLATHPHADHIGGMPEVVEAFEIGKVLFSDVPADLIPTTKIYEQLLDSIAGKGLKITKASPGIAYDLGDGAMLKILAPLNQDQEDLNENSIVCRLDFGETSFLFTGDAGISSENDMIKRYGSTLSATVLKLGHHGSNTATQEKWLNQVNPKIVVAEVGADNKYGHPHKEILQRIEERGLTFYRTDRNGTIVMASDGGDITVTAEKE
ncbi:ComEC/Rec2 family competence protein [Marasmitruncus massiliensis]|uniref:ComEC/Rec2 family competence protein n=1 Tax=Marasmitruncus massiliensis TaxID=1944642 RepID=UPI000C7E486B|nr:MBL fold metallo-hydrolase [Marasmitruncus massiliensis]